MSDKVTTSHELKIENLFVDGDTRTITLKNPKAIIETSEITALETLILNGDGTESILIGDKYGSDFRRIQEVREIIRRLAKGTNAILRRQAGDRH